MISLPFGFGQLTPSAQRVRRRTREAGTGIPDLLAPSAYREVEPSEELVEAAEPLYAALNAARAGREQVGGRNGSTSSERVGRKRAEEIAEKDDREILRIDV